MSSPISFVAIEKPPLVCLLFRPGEEKALALSLQSLHAAETQGEILVVVENGASAVPRCAQNDYRLVIMPPGRGSLIARAWKTLRREDRDVVFLRAGVRVSRNWEILLCCIACLERNIAAVSPVSARDPYFSLTPGPNRPFADPDVVNSWLQSAPRDKVFDTPVFLGACVFFRYAALESLREEHCDLSNDALAQALWARGWKLVGCQSVYVDDSEAAWEPHDPVLEKREDVSDFLRHHPLSGLRWAFQHQRKEDKALPMKRIRPTQLHVAHSWGGGLGQWVEDFVAADRERRNLVLRSIGTWGRFGQRLALYLGGSAVPIREWELSLPIRATAGSHYEYMNVLDEITTLYGVEVILVSSLIGHSLDVLRTGLRTVAVLHDYYPICPYLYSYFGKECAACTHEIMKQCFRHNTLPKVFRNVDEREWISLRKSFVQTLHSYNIPLVAPSPSVFRNLFRLEPRLAQLEHRVVPHGLPPYFAKERRSLSRQPPSASSRTGLHVLIPGRVSEEKGRSILVELIQRLPLSFTFTLLGCGEDGLAFKKFPNVTVVPHYQRERLPDIIDRLQPDLGLLASVVPETFSYTLSELWAMGIPVVATRVGSFADRVQEGVTGWLCDPTCESLSSVLRQLADCPQRLNEVASNLEGSAFRTTAAMVRDYHTITPLPYGRRQRLHALRFHSYKSSPDLSPVHRILYVDPNAPLRTVLVAFLDYVIGKLQDSPRLPSLARKGFVVLLRGSQRLLRLQR